MSDQRQDLHFLKLHGVTCAAVSDTWRTLLNCESTLQHWGNSASLEDVDQLVSAVNLMVQRARCLCRQMQDLARDGVDSPYRAPPARWSIEVPMPWAFIADVYADIERELALQLDRLQCIVAELATYQARAASATQAVLSAVTGRG